MANIMFQGPSVQQASSIEGGNQKGSGFSLGACASHAAANIMNPGDQVSPEIATKAGVAHASDASSSGLMKLMSDFVGAICGAIHGFICRIVASRQTNTAATRIVGEINSEVQNAQNGKATKTATDLAIEKVAHILLNGANAGEDAAYLMALHQIVGKDATQFEAALSEVGRQIQPLLSEGNQLSSSSHQNVKQEGDNEFVIVAEGRAPVDALKFLTTMVARILQADLGFTATDLAKLAQPILRADEDRFDAEKLAPKLQGVFPAVFGGVGAVPTIEERAAVIKAVLGGPITDATFGGKLCRALLGTGSYDPYTNRLRALVGD